jgi:hypothetical protein
MRPVISFVILLGFILTLIWACNENKQKEIARTEVLEKEGIIDPKSCVSCHKIQVDGFLKTGKGRSFYPASNKEKFENWNAKPVYDPDKNFYYQPIQAGNQFFVKEFRLENTDTIHSRTERIDFFIGSGNQTRSYLYKRNGYLYEIPITWYSKKKIWDLSPGYEGGSNSRFDREIGLECLYCHNSGFEAIPSSINRYSNFGQALACESCHGGVKAHLNEMVKTKGKSGNLKIVSLGKLPLQAQLDVCRQCHLEGVKVRKENAKQGDYKPGQLLSDFYEVFIPATGDNDFGFASHAERLQLSQCFINSAGKMNCSTCHDAHASIPTVGKNEFFSQKCLTCHAGNAHEIVCLELKTKNLEPQKSNCLKCHMQTSGTNDIPHVSSTDHWIQKSLSKNRSEKGKKMVFKNFAGSKFSIRDKAMAYLQYGESHGDSTKLNEVSQFLKYLEPENQLKYHYLKNNFWPNGLDSSTFSKSENPWTWFYWSQIKKKSAYPFISQLEMACQLAPEMIEFQYKLALAKDESTNPELAYQKVLDLNPFHVKALSNLGFYALQSGDYATAESLLKNAIGQDPDYVLANENLSRCYMEQGKFAQCKVILNRLIKQNPNENRYKQILASIP